MTATAYERVLGELRNQGKKVKESDSRQEARAQCPGHDGSNPTSLSIKSIEGQALIYCHVGCNSGDIMAALGLSMPDLFDNPRDTAYTYDDGRIAHRTSDKRFWQSGNTNGGRTTLYRLGQVQAAVSDGKTVWLVEGEKDVHAIEAIGAIATTAPMGAKNFHKVDVSPLTGARVKAIVDHDDAGHEWARQVRQRLNGVTASLEFYRAKAGKDAADHIAAGHGLGELDEVQQDSDLDGAQLLTIVYDFLGRFVVYPSEAAHVAHTLWVAHTFFMDCWESTPRIAFLSPEPGSGKSRALEVTEPLVNRPVHAVNTTPAYLFRKVSDEAGLPVILYDEIDTVFGPKAKDNEDVRGMLNAGHRRGAVAGRCVTKGKTIVTEELPAYCAVALAGLDDLPDTLHSRSMVIRMRRRAPNEKAEPWRHRLHAPVGEGIRAKLEDWAVVSADQVQWPDMPDGVEDRNADIWEAPIAVADLAGGEWPERARVAAVALVADSKAASPSLGIRLLADLRDTFGSQDAMRTEDILRELNKIEDAPWGDIRGKELDSRGLARRLKKYDITPKDVRVGNWHGKGYKREDFWDAWTRYLDGVSDEDPNNEGPTINTQEGIKEEGLWDDVGPAAYKSATSATDATGPTCQVCERELTQLHSIQRGMCETCWMAAA
jgi:hypothetical protein